MDAVWYCIADSAYWVFKIMRAMGMGPNFLFMGIIVSAFLYWMYLQKKYNDEADAAGKLR